MSAYINLTTGEYPRHVGDIALAPNDNFAPVEWVDQPAFDAKTQRCGEGQPALVDGVYKMTWIVREATPEEIEAASKPPEDRRFPWE